MATLNVSIVLIRPRRRAHLLQHARAVLRRAPRNERPAIMGRLVEQMCRQCYRVDLDVVS